MTRRPERHPHEHFALDRPGEAFAADIPQDQMMSATNELAADGTPRSTLFGLMEAPNRRRNWRFGRSLQFHGPAWESLDSADVTTLLQRPTQRPHVNVQEIARLLGEPSHDDASAGSI